MDLDLSPETLAFRAEVRDFLAAHVPRTPLPPMDTAEGFAASVTSTTAGHQLCQHHCPVAHVAAAFPQLCEAETEAFADLLGSHVQRLATIAHGDHVCTTSVPHLTGVAPARTPERTHR